VQGSAPASGAANRALAVRRADGNRGWFGNFPCVRVWREGAPDRSRGGCATEKTEQII